MFSRLKECRRLNGKTPAKITLTTDTVSNMSSAWWLNYPTYIQLSPHRQCCCCSAATYQPYFYIQYALIIIGKDNVKMMTLVESCLSLEVSILLMSVKYSTDIVSSKTLV